MLSIAAYTSAFMGNAWPGSSVFHQLLFLMTNFGSGCGLKFFYKYALIVKLELKAANENGLNLPVIKLN
jgi:hypothetical protein